jgi:hypothetical protein
MTIEVHPSAAPGAMARSREGSATFEPAVDDLSATVIVAASDPAVHETVRAAAMAENLPTLDASRLPASLDDQALIAIDHDASSDSSADVRRITEGSGASRATVLAFTRNRPPTNGEGLIAEWLVWPASLGHVRTKLRAALLRRACRWQAAPQPPDEAHRLASLHSLGLLDTPPEERFDRYTRLACETLGVPMALITMVDSYRQWFKSHYGTDVEETHRDESLCAYAILGPDVFQVPDLLEDDRFADNPAVSGENRVRFYAGVPLTSPDGSRVGAFCVIDHEPRCLDDEQLDVLRMFAAKVQAELDQTTDRS